MPDVILFVTIPIFAAICAALLQWVYNAFPEPWLQDYDFNPKSENIRLAKRMRFLPHGILLTVSIVLLHLIGLYFNPEYFDANHCLRAALMFLPIFPLALIVVSDKLNRIIPDQLVIACILLSSIGFVADLTQGNHWIALDAPFYYFLLNRILGGVIGAGMLLLIAFLGALISKQEAMGQGDIKLIFACGLLTGGFGLVVTMLLAFIVGGAFAVPLLIKKRIRISREEKQIRESKNPVKERLKIQLEKERISFADDPDYIAFGPFLAMGTIVFLVLETPIYQYFTDNILPSLEYIF